MTIDVVFRNEKGDELTWEEMDANLANLQVAIETKKDNFSILPVAQGGTGVATIAEAKQVLDVPEFANQIDYMPDGIGAVATDVQTKLREFISVKDFGAVGDGVADDTAAIQSAVSAAGSGVLVFGKGLTYKVSSAILVSNSGLTIEGNGSTLNGSAQSASVSLDDRYALKIEGSIGSAVAITSDVSAGAVSIPISSAAGISAGDVVLLYSAEKWPEGATGSTSYKGALHRVRSVDSGTALTIMDGTFFSYATASGANIKKVTTVDNVTVNRLKVVMGGLNKAHSGIRIKYATNCRINDCKTKDTEDTGVRAEYCFGGGVYGGDFSYCNSPGEGSSGVGGNTGYGVCPSTATRNFNVVGASFRGNRHSVAGGGTYPAIAVRVSDCSIDGGRSSAYSSSYQLDCHEDCLMWVFDGNHVSGSSLSTGAGGILVRGQKTTVINNTISSVYQYGILLQNFDTGGSSSSGAVVKDNTIYNSRLEGIVVSGATAVPWSDVIIEGNEIFSPGGEGIILFGTTNAMISGNNIRMSAAANKSGIRLVGTAATAGNYCSKVAINGNVIDSPTLHGVRADYGDSVVISGNVIMNATGECVSLTNCTDISVSACKLQTAGATRSGVYINACTHVSVTGCNGENTAAASGASSGAYILGASTDVSVTGNAFRAFNRGVYSASPANYIAVTGNNARTSLVASVDVSASANTASSGNL